MRLTRRFRHGTRTPERNFYRACAIGGVLATIVFAWFALEGRFEPFRLQALSNFYEEQARSLLHGHWDASPGAFLFERFKVNGHFYTYFGPWPALLRIPFVLFTHSLDGHLSRVSMIAAFVVMLVYTSRLAWQTRSFIRGTGEPTRASLVGAGAFVFVAGCGSTALFLAGFTWVYHEAILWGAAWAIASFSYLLAYLVAPTRRALVLASMTATFSYLSRGSVGLGPVGALGLVLAARVAVRAREAWRRRRGEGVPADAAAWWLRALGLGGDAANRRAWPVAVATAIPVTLYAYVNYVKFGTLFGTPPYQLQDLIAPRSNRVAALAANHGSLFGVKYAPTLVVQYFRPDAISFDRFFPWVSFAPPPRVIGGVTFESLNLSASVTATSTLLLLLSMIGIVAAIRAPRPEGEGPSAAVLRVPLAGALAGCVGTFVIAFVDERYLGDFIPLFVLAGAAGLWYTGRLIADRPRAVRRAVAALLVVVGAWSVWTTAGLTLLQQREFGWLVSPATRAQLIGFQLDVHEIIPGGGPSRVEHSELPLPPPGRAGSLLIVGKCAGLYWSNGFFWHPVEETPRTGRFSLRVKLPDAAPGTLEPLMSSRDKSGASILWIRFLRGNRVRFEYQWTGKTEGIINSVTAAGGYIGLRTSPSIALTPNHELSLAIRLDPAGYVGLHARGKRLLSTFAPVATTTAVVGSQRYSTHGVRQFTGTIRSLPIGTPLCDRVEAFGH